MVAMVSASSMRRTSGTPISSAIASRGEIVLGRPEPTADEHRVAALEQVAERLDDTRLVVADHPVLEGVDARRRELLADPGAVGVDDLPQQELGSDRQGLRIACTGTYLGAMATDEDIEFPTGSSDERELLLIWLTYLRGAVTRNLDEVGDTDAHWTPDGALISLVGIVNHLTHVEWRWIDGGMLGEPVSRSEEEFTPGPELTRDAALAAYRARAISTDAVVRRDTARRAVSVGGGHRPAMGAAPLDQRDRASRRSRRRDTRAARRHDGRVMATQADVRRLARALPDTSEGDDRFGFSVRNGNKDKGFAWVWMERVEPKQPSASPTPKCWPSAWPTTPKSRC